MVKHKNTLASHSATTDYIEEAHQRVDAAELNQDEKNNLHSEIDKALAFPLGKFMLEHHGLNGEWSHNLLPWLFLSKLDNHPEGTSPDPLPGEFVNDLQEFLYTQSPLVIATQQRFEIFVEIIKHQLEASEHSLTIANFPCGWMSDISLTLKLHEKLASKAQITGFDLDSENEDGARNLLTQLNIDASFAFVHADATKAIASNEVFAIPVEHIEKYDFIVAHGLSLYLDEKDCATYFSLLSAMLKPGGILLTSTMTPPTEWRDIDAELANRQRHFFFTLCDCKFSIARSAEEVSNMLENTGLQVTEVHEDQRNMFPAILAKKL